jgi:hypothetical protein
MAWNVSNYDFLLNPETAVDWSVRSELHDFGDENYYWVGWLYDSDERNFHDSLFIDYGCFVYGLADSSHAERQYCRHLHLGHFQHFVQRLYRQHLSVESCFGGWVFLSDVSDFYDSNFARSVP